ncbi:MAG: hypothetical protein HBSIN02_12210 [Bacteroidia bacterium]|nr:MAG: hypothetical protein HBSIN02_12210 [Bacteroidia bacterium]
MGRTVPTFTNIIDSELAGWSKYRRGLPRDDQELFDEIFRAAKRRLASNFYAMRTIPFESIIMSIVIEQGKHIAELKQRMEQLQKKALPVGNGEIVEE